MPILMVSLSVVSLASMALGRMYPYSRQSSSLTPSQDPLRWTSTQLTPFCSMSTILWMKQPLYITTECFSTAPRILTVHRVFLNGSFTLSRWSRGLVPSLMVFLTAEFLLVVTLTTWFPLTRRVSGVPTGSTLMHQ